MENAKKDPRNEFSVRKEPETWEEVQKIIEETGSFLEGVSPLNRNFGIVLEGPDSNIQIKLKHKDGRVKDLSEFLPPDHRFSKGKEFAYNKRGKAVLFDEKQIPLRGFLLSLFHEIGHAYQKTEHPTTFWENAKAFYFALREWKRLETGNSKLTKKVLAKDILPDWYQNKISQWKSRRERDAWAYSLNTLRRFEDEGWEPFRGFESNSRIRDYINYCLYTYDVGHALKKITSAAIRGKPEEILDHPEKIFAKRFLDD